MSKSFGIVCFLTGCSALFAQSEVRSIVTVEAHHKNEAQIPALNAGDVMAFERHERLQVTGLVPWSGDHAGLELFVLVDDASGSSLANQLADIKHFIQAQPEKTLVGVGYMRNGAVQTVQDLTADHAAAAKALRIPLSSAGIMPSPYLSLQDLIKRWPDNANRHEVVLISSGIDPLGGLGPENPYLNSAIEDAQRHGIVVYAIYTPAAGHGGHSMWLINWAQSHLAQITEETGGESYMMGFGDPVSFVSYLDEISSHLAHQYSVTFLMKTEPKGSLRSTRFATEIPNAELVAPTKAYVPGSQSGK